MSLLWNLRDFSPGAAANSLCVFSTIVISTFVGSSMSCGPCSKLLALQPGPVPHPFLTPGSTQSWQLSMSPTEREYEKHSQVETMPKRPIKHCTFSLRVGHVSCNYLSFILQELSWPESAPKTSLMWWAPETLGGFLSPSGVRTPHGNPPVYVPLITHVVQGT